MKHVFSDSFLAAIERLSLEIKRSPPRAAHGSHLSNRTGQSLEFRDFQNYTPGDDLRRVDWNIYRRTKHLFVRRFERPTAVPVFILVDASASMLLEEPSRYATAARMAAAVASAAIASQNPVYVEIADGGGRSGSGAPRAITGRRGLVRVLADLAADRAEGGSGIGADLEALRPFLASKGSGILVLISDFFDERGADALVDALRLTPQRLVLCRVTQPWDTNPELSGDFELLDCETDAKLHLSTDTAVLDRYKTAYRTYFDRIDTYVAARGAKQVLINAAQDTIPQLETLFPSGVMTL